MGGGQRIKISVKWKVKALSVCNREHNKDQKTGCSVSKNRWDRLGGQLFWTRMYSTHTPVTISSKNSVAVDSFSGMDNIQTIQPA
jgi:hypothetical protein